MVAVKKKTDDMIAGELVVLVDNQAAVQNLERFADYKGFDTVWEKTGDKEYAVQILVGPKALRGVDEYFSIYARKQPDQKGKEKETDAPEKAEPERGAKLEPEHRPEPERRPEPESRPELEHRPAPESRPEPKSRPELEHLEAPGETVRPASSWIPRRCWRPSPGRRSQSLIWNINRNWGTGRSRSVVPSRSADRSRSVAPSRNPDRRRGDPPPRE